MSKWTSAVFESQIINMDEEPTIFSILLESIQAVMSIAGFIGKKVFHILHYAPEIFKMWS